MNKVSIPVNKNEVAFLMLKWLDAQEKADSLRWEIERQIVILGKTMDVGTIRCSYSKGRDKYEGWEQAVNLRLQAIMTDDVYEEISEYANELVEAFTTTETKKVITTDWKLAAEALGILREIVQYGTPKATLKLMEE